MRRFVSLLLFVPLALVAVLAPLGCSDDAAPPGSTTTTPDGSTSSSDGTAPTDDGAPTPGQDGGSCSPVVNGFITSKLGTFAHQITNVAGANLIPPNLAGNLECEGSFDPNSGVSFGGGAYSGAFSITCFAALSNEYYGLLINGVAKPKTGDQYKVGKGLGVPLGDGGYTTNGQCDVAWEEGPRCDTKQDKSKSWNGEKEAGLGGVLVIDNVTGADVTYHLSATAMTLSTNGLNYTGTGTFSVAGQGTIKLIGL